VFCFYAYGLLFESALASPGYNLPARCNNSSADVTIHLGKVETRLADPSIDFGHFQSSSDKFLLTVDQVARYQVIAGNEIVIDVHPDADMDRVRLFLFGSAMGALLYQRALFPLHGSAIETPLGAMIFTGPSGIGKSTLSAHFQERGYRLLSDDVCAISQNAAGDLQVLPAFPQMRLCADAFERLRGSSADAAAARFDVDKFVVPPANGLCTEPIPLGAIHVLSNHELPDIILKSAVGFDRLNHLVSNLYRPHYLRGFDSRGDVMHLASLVARNADVTEIVRPRDAGRIDELMDRLETKWNAEYEYRGKEAALRPLGYAA
jgi:hypothetical protein